MAPIGHNWAILIQIDINVHNMPKINLRKLPKQVHIEPKLI